MKKAFILAILLLPFTVFGFETDLRIGMSGTEVTDLQTILIENGCLNTTPTGYFGLLTQQGVECMKGNTAITPISNQSEEIRKLKQEISDLKRKLAKYEDAEEEKEDDEDEIQDIIEEMYDINAEISEVKKIQSCDKLNRSSCYTSNERAKLLKPLEDRKRELQKRYAILKGDLDKLPAEPYIPCTGGPAACGA